MIRDSRGIGIVADDLTGACDVAGSFAKPTGSVCVNITSEGFSEHEDAMQVTNLSTRVMSPDACKHKVQVFAAGLENCPVIFMKIDTALRGCVGAQIEGVLAGVGPRRVIVAPAFPRIGRTTRGGIQYDSGVPISETDYAQDALTPISSSDVAEIIGQTGSPEFEVLDAETDNDLDGIVEEVLNGAAVVLVGSLGLADALAKKVTPANEHTLEIPACQRALIICGSRYKRSYDQIQAALNRYGGHVVTLHPDDAADTPADLPLAGPLFVCTGTEPIRDNVCPPEEIALRLSSKCLTLIRESLVDGIGIIGGETANCVFAQIGTLRLNVAGRIANIVSYGSIADGMLANRPFATKGGSVGGKDAIVRMIEYLVKGSAS